MWTSSRNKKVLGAAALLACLSLPAQAAGPISSIAVFQNGGGTFTVGVATNTPSLESLYFNVLAPGGVAPSAGQTVIIELLSGATPISGGISPVSFVTDGTNTFYGGGPIQAHLPVTFFAPGVLTVRASTIPAGGGTPGVRLVTVAKGPAAKLVLVPTGLGVTLSEGHNPATHTGLSGVPTSAEPNTPFDVKVVLTDAGFNQITTGTDNVAFSPVPLVTFTPSSSGALSGGERTFSVFVEATRVTIPLTVDDITNGAVANGLLSVSVAGPAPEEVFPFPSPFNPRQQPITFRTQLNEATTVTLQVKDRFGQDVWHMDVPGAQGQTDVNWDGRNEQGHIVAAGIYYVLLEVDGDVKSKKKFGVVK